MLRVGSLFSGIGGIELGLERTGYFKTEWFVEIEPFCQKVLKKHWPGVPIYEDITKINWSHVPPIDMLTGGFPCQDISTANPHGKGIEGTRSGLWKEYAKAIRELRPRYALIENVSAVVRKGLDVVIADLASQGYDAEWIDLRASDLGAPHRRERIFIVAYSDAERYLDRGIGEQSDESGQQAQHHADEGIETESSSDIDPISRHEIHRRESNHEGRFATDSISQRRGGRNPEGPRQSEDGSEIQRRSTPRFPADYMRDRIQRFNNKKLQGKQGFSWTQDVRRVEDFGGRQDIPEPLFRGSRDGVPDWVDRIKACGNAVVPQCAELIGEMIMEYDKNVT